MTNDTRTRHKDAPLTHSDAHLMPPLPMQPCNQATPLTKREGIEVLLA